MNKKNVSRRFFSVAMLLAFALLLSGCGKKQIFQKAEDPYAKVELEVDELENDTYYIKNGTKFSAVYKPGGRTNGQYSTSSVFWVSKDEKMIPSYYKNEVIAYATENTYKNGVSMQRYSYNGYSFGLYGAQIDQDGYITFSVGQNTVKDTSINLALSNAKSDNIRLVSINDQNVTPEMLNTAGCITGLEKGKNYQISFYAGSYYQTANVSADIAFLQYYEAFQIPDAEITKNGYLKMSVQNDLKSGYYFLDGKGFFKYFDFERGEKDISSIDMNVAYYTSESDEYAQFMQQYVALVSYDTSDATFQVTYDPSGYTDEQIICKLTAPDDRTTYDMIAHDGTASTTLAVAIAGKYTISIYPKDLAKISVDVVGGTTSQDAMVKKGEVVYTEDSQNIIFYAVVVGNDNVWGTVTYEDGTAYEMEFNTRTGRLEYEMPYVKEGVYRIDVYHYEDTAIQEISSEENHSNEQVDIITVEE